MQEFSILTNNFTAEFGRASGGIVNLATKSGTNNFHGTAYWFGRYSALSSNSFDNNANGIDKTRFTRNQFGYSVGGPIIKDKLFFFQSSEFTRIRSLTSEIVAIPSAAFISASNATNQAFYTACGATRSNLQTIGSYTRQQVCGACSGAVGALAANTVLFDRVQYLRPGDSGAGLPGNDVSQVAKLDWTISTNTQAYARYAYEHGENFAGTNAHSPYAGFDTPFMVGNHNGLFSVTHTWGPHTVSQSKVVIQRLGQEQPLGTSPVIPSMYFRDNAQASVLGTRVALPGYLPFSPGSAIPFGGPQNFLQTYQDVNYSKGKHNWRFGGSYVFIQDNRTFGAYENAVATYGTSSLGSTSLNRFLAGNLARFRVAIDPQGKFPCKLSSNPSVAFNGALPAALDPACQITTPANFPNFSRSNRYHEFAWYLQDSWRVNSHFTLNLGLRWEYFGVQHNKNAALDSNYYDGAGGDIFTRIATGRMSITANSDVKGLWAKDWNNFAPRLGFAWDVFGDGRTSIRGGYGVGYERNFGNVTFNVIQNPPNYAVLQLDLIPVQTANFGPLSGNIGPQPLRTSSARNVDPHIRTAYAHLWSLSVEREVIKNLIVGLDYSGSKGSKLYTIENPNRPGAGNVYGGIPCPNPIASPCFDRLQTTQWTGINRRGDNGYSNYNSLNVRVESRNIRGSGLNLRANYTYSHAFDNISSTFSESSNNPNLGLLDPFNPKLDYGSADFDQRHRLVLSGVWEVPFAKNTSGFARYILHGWEMAPIFTAATGSPFTIFDSTNEWQEVMPRVMLANGMSIARTATGTPLQDPLGTPNTLAYIQLYQNANMTTGTFTNPLFDTSYVNPIQGTSEFGPYPSSMTARNFFRGPGFWNLDFGIYKNTKVTERCTVQFRTELFNAFNHANMYILGDQTDVWAVNYVPARRNGRRNIQMALKLIF